MKNLQEPCQKSAAEIVALIDDNTILSPTLSKTVNDCKKPLFIIDKDVPHYVKEAVLSVAKGKDFTLLTPFEDEGSHYDFFGITKGHTPVLLNKLYLEHDAAIVVSFVRYDSVYGYYGGKSLIFPGIGAEKSRNALLKHALHGESFYKHPLCFAGSVKGNPIESEVLDAVMITRQNSYFFGINLIAVEDSVKVSACGDLFMSHIKAGQEFAALYPLPQEPTADGVVLNLKSGSLQDNIDLVEQAVLRLKKGGRLYIDGRGLTSFGSSIFAEAFYTPKREEIFSKLLNYFSIDLFQAMILKYICENYHIAICSHVEEGLLRQAGLNPITDHLRQDFLKNCSKTEEVYDAGRFTASR